MPPDSIGAAKTSAHVQVHDRMLKPNLHMAVCNLLLQEMYGPAALCTKWFMEKYGPFESECCSLHRFPFVRLVVEG